MPAEFVSENELFAPNPKISKTIDIDPESSLIIDRCLNHVRARLASSSSSATNANDHKENAITLAAHLDDVAVCRDRVWQHIYHPRNKNSGGLPITDENSVGVTHSHTAIDAATGTIRSIHSSSASSPGGEEAPRNPYAFDALRRMEEAQQRLQKQAAEAKRADVIRRSIGTTTEEVSSGDAIANIVTRRFTSDVVSKKELSKSVEEASSSSQQQNEQQSNSNNDAEKTEKAATQQTATSRNHDHHQHHRKPLTARQQAAWLLKQQRTRDTLLCLYDAVRPDPLIGAHPLPQCHFANNPYATKRSANLLLLKYLGTMYPGGKSDLRKELPFALNKKTMSIERIQTSSSSTDAIAIKSAQGRALVLYEDRRRRAILTAIATQLGAGSTSPATVADFIRSSKNEANDHQLRIGAGAPKKSSVTVAEAEKDEAANLQNILTLQTLYNLPGGSSPKTVVDAIAAAAFGRPASVVGLEYALASLTTSPFNHSHYTSKLFGYIQPTAIGSHSYFPLTRFNIFELDHLPTAGDKMRANMRKVMAAREAERKQKKSAHGSGDTSASLASTSASGDSEQLLLKKWSLFGTIFPGRHTYHVKGLWSANAKLSIIEAQKALDVDLSAATVTKSASSDDANSDGNGSNISDINEEDAAVFSVLGTDSEEGAARIVKSGYRLGTGQRERGLVGFGIDIDRVRAIELVGKKAAAPPQQGAEEKQEIAIDEATTKATASSSSDVLLVMNNGEEATVPAEANPDQKRRRAGVPETVVRPLLPADRKLLGTFQDTELFINWRRFWNPRWSVEPYVRHTEGIPTEKDRVRVAEATCSSSAIDALHGSELPAVVGPTATSVGVRIRADHSGRLFTRSPSSLIDMWFAPIVPSIVSGGGSVLSSPLRGWAASTYKTACFVDPIQRHASVGGQVDVVKVTPLPWYRGKSAYDDDVNATEDERKSPSSSSSVPTTIAFIPRLYGRLRDLLSFDLRLRVASEYKHGGDVAAFVTPGDSFRYSEVVANNNNNDNDADSSRTNTQAVERLRKFVRAVKLPSHSLSNTVRGVSGHEDLHPSVYTTERTGGRWFVTSSVEVSKPISFIGGGGGGGKKAGDEKTTAASTASSSSPTAPPLRFLLFWNGLWSENRANNKETIGYAVRREPHASRKEFKGWYNAYLPTSLECSWASLWSDAKQQFTNEPAPADLPAGSTYFKFMKCGAVWDF